MIKNKTYKLLLITGIMLISSFSVKAQVALKNNFLYDIATTPNLGIEVGLTKKTTAQLFYGLNPWKFSETKQMRHWLLMPEYRWWTCSRFNGHFFGVHGMGGEFNVQGIKVPFGMLKCVRDNRYEGWYIGGGLTYGYQWILSKHWNLEGSLGVGYDYIQFKKYECGECGKYTDRDHTNYWGVTKLCLSIVYLF